MFIADIVDVLRWSAGEDVGIGGGQGWPFEAMLNNLTATALGGKEVQFFLNLFKYKEGKKCNKKVYPTYISSIDRVYF